MLYPWLGRIISLLTAEIVVTPHIPTSVCFSTLNLNKEIHLLRDFRSTLFPMVPVYTGLAHTDNIESLSQCRIRHPATKTKPVSIAKMWCRSGSSLAPVE